MPKTYLVVALESGGWVGWRGWWLEEEEEEGWAATGNEFIDVVEGAPGAGLAMPGRCAYIPCACEIRIVMEGPEGGCRTSQRFLFIAEKPALLFTPPLLFLSPSEENPVMIQE